MILKQNTHHKRSTFVAFDFILVIIEWIKNKTNKTQTHTHNTQKTKTCVVKIVVIIQNNKNSLHR